jgi:hypothetical protein
VDPQRKPQPKTYLDASERLCLFPQFLSDSVEFIEQFAVHHRHWNTTTGQQSGNFE